MCGRMERCLSFFSDRLPWPERGRGQGQDCRALGAAVACLFSPVVAVSLGNGAGVTVVL